MVVGLAEFVTHDKWQFEFVNQPKIQVQAIERSIPRNASVNLFSAGLDSLCGAAAAFQRGEAPVFVTHSPPSFSTTAYTIEGLTKALGFEHCSTVLANFCFQASDKDSSGRRRMFPERSRRSRPLLFLSMAGAIALELKVPKINLSENCVLAINLPFQHSVHGALISRHAHPETLLRFEALLRSVWPFEGVPSVINPFSRETKGEELRALNQMHDFANRTVSCEYACQQVASLIHWLREQRRDSSNVKECGLCYPCLVRRVALHAAGGHYVFDARLALTKPNSYSGFPLFGRLRSNVTDLLTFCLGFVDLKPSRFVVSYMPEITFAAGASDNVNRTARKMFRLYRRFASEVLRYFQR